MTTERLAQLFLDLGAGRAVNLDGGESSTLVVGEGGRVRVVTRPSDPAGERAVGNALAIVPACAGR
jgi:exopolysaccharide biosynthesis protein